MGIKEYLCAEQWCFRLFFPTTDATIASSRRTDTAREPAPSLPRKKTPLGWDHKVLGLRFGPIWAESFIITITAGFFHMYRNKREIHWKQSNKYVTVNLNHKPLVILLYFIKWLPLKFGSLFGKGAGAGSCGFPCSLQIKFRRCLPSFTVPWPASARSRCWTCAFSSTFQRSGTVTRERLGDAHRRPGS